MLLYDRYNSKLVDSAKLPTQIDLGRYYVPETGADITNRIINVGADKIIRQGILESTNSSIQDLFCQFYHTLEKSENGSFAVRPLIQSVKDKLYLNDFEKLLEDKVFHLEEIFRQPHYLLNRTIEKVNVSRAKRIPAKSYQNLASHTEDWLHKSIVNFKPRRILTEELDLLYDVYENQATVALVERSLLYLGSRIKEVCDLNDFLIGYEKILADRHDEKGWYKKIERNLSLIGDVYEDRNYQKGRDRSGVLVKTHERLLQIQKRLRALQLQPFYGEVNKRVVMSLLTEREIKPTNVIANHKHYRYVRELWRKLNTVNKGLSEDERSEYEQQVISGVRSYAKSLITYIATDVFRYEVIGTYSDWSGIHKHFCSISLNEDSQRRIILTVGNAKLCFVVIAGEFAENQDVILPENTYVLSLGFGCNRSRVIGISPYDVDSVERVGRVIREHILRAYINEINKPFGYPRMLKDYVKYLDCAELKFVEDYRCRILGIPDVNLDVADIIKVLDTVDSFNRRGRFERDEIKIKMKDLIVDVNANFNNVLRKLRCQSLDCCQPIQRRNAGDLNYLSCPCGFVLSCAKGHVLFKNRDVKYSPLSADDWGMDCVEFDL